MKNKYVFFVFRGEPMFFIHLLLNALEMSCAGEEVKIVLEYESVKLLPELYNENSSLFNLYKKCLERNLIAGVCKACSQKFGTYEIAIEKGLTILEELANHPSMYRFIKEGYQIIPM